MKEIARKKISSAADDPIPFTPDCQIVSTPVVRIPEKKVEYIHDEEIYDFCKEISVDIKPSVQQSVLSQEKRNSRGKILAYERKPCSLVVRKQDSSRNQQNAQINGGKTNLKCDICSKEFICTRSLTRHLICHQEKLPYKCPHCDKWFASTANISRHINYKHKKTKKFACDQCDYACFESTKLKRHNMLKHSKDKDPLQKRKLKKADDVSKPEKKHKLTNSSEAGRSSSQNDACAAIIQLGKQSGLPEKNKQNEECPVNTRATPRIFQFSTSTINDNQKEQFVPEVSNDKKSCGSMSTVPEEEFTGSDDMDGENNGTRYGFNIYSNESEMNSDTDEIDGEFMNGKFIDEEVNDLDPNSLMEVNRVCSRSNGELPNNVLLTEDSSKYKTVADSNSYMTRKIDGFTGISNIGVEENGVKLCTNSSKKSFLYQENEGLINRKARLFTLNIKNYKADAIRIAREIENMDNDYGFIIHVTGTSVGDQRGSDVIEMNDNSELPFFIFREFESEVPDVTSVC